MNYRGDINMSEDNRVQHISEFGMRTNENDNAQIIIELQASNNALREDLEKVKAQNDKYGKDGHIDHVVVNALYSTPAESLQAHDDELIEKCAKVCDEWIGQEPLADAIRAIKEVK